MIDLFFPDIILNGIINRGTLFHVRFVLKTKINEKYTVWQVCIMFGHVGLGNVAALLTIDISFLHHVNFVKKK